MLARLVRMVHRGDAGFTLIELMIVIAVIMILAAIILPQFAMARERARRASCVSNQRTIENAVAMWVTDNPMPLYVGGTLNTSTPGYNVLVAVGGGAQYVLAGAFLEPDDPAAGNQLGQDYYLSNGSASGAIGSANPTALSYGHIVCAYAQNPNGCGAGVNGDPWVACYNKGGAGTGLNHARGTAASP